MSRKATAAARRTRCSTASVPIRTGRRGTGGSTPARRGPATSPTSAPSSAASSSRSRLTPARKRLHPQPAAGRAHDRAGLVAARAAQHLLAPRLRRGRTAAGAAGQLAAVTAGQQAGAARAVVDADQGPALDRRGIVEDGPGQTDELLGEHAAARVGAAAIDPLQDGPARPLLAGARAPASAARRAPPAPPAARARRGRRERPRAGPARSGRPPRCRWGRSPPGRPRRGHRARRRPPAGAPGPRPRPGCRPRRATRRGPAPSRPRSATPGVPSRAVSRSAHPADGTSTSTLPARARTAGSVQRRTAPGRSDRSAGAGARR